VEKYKLQQKQTWTIGASMEPHFESGILHRKKQPETEVAAVAKCDWPSDWLGKFHLKAISYLRSIPLAAAPKFQPPEVSAAIN
jgi:hypothetical protein